jgi:hypothetical protein
LSRIDEAPKDLLIVGGATTKMLAEAGGLVMEVVLARALADVWLVRSPAEVLLTLIENVHTPAIARVPPDMVIDDDPALAV